MVSRLGMNVSELSGSELVEVISGFYRVIDKIFCHYELDVVYEFKSLFNIVEVGFSDFFDFHFSVLVLPPFIVTEKIRQFIWMIDDLKLV
jgi:hypothetical protein